jgi:hypothetical protein
MEGFMEESPNLVVSRCGKLLSLILGMVFIAGCQSLSFDPRGHTVPAAKLIILPQSGDYAGTYNNEDLNMAYKFVRNQGQLGISGTVRFADRITMGFIRVQTFHLDAILVDAQGKVLDMTGLTSAADVNMTFESSIDFSKMVTLPPNTAALAFSYRGVALSSGSGDDGGSMDFWDYPLY